MPKSQSPSGLELLECTMEPVARDVIDVLFQDGLPTTDVDCILDVLEDHWEYARRVLHEVPDVDFFDAYDQATVCSLVAHCLRWARAQN